MAYSRQKMSPPLGPYWSSSIASSTDMRSRMSRDLHTLSLALTFARRTLEVLSGRIEVDQVRHAPDALAVLYQCRTKSRLPRFKFTRAHGNTFPDPAGPITNTAAPDDICSPGTTVAPLNHCRPVCRSQKKSHGADPIY